MSVNWREVFEKSEFWAVKSARAGIERARKKGKDLLTVKCANTPTGVLHIGNANDLIRSYLIAKSAEMLGFRSRVVFTPDDRDPVRGFPPVVCDKEGNIVPFPPEVRREFEQKYDGMSVAFIPDPFRCHTTWAEHFLSVYMKELDRLGIRDAIRFEVYSPNLLYFHGEWDEYVRKVLENADQVRRIYSGFKQHVREFAFSPICENCGRIGTTHVTSYSDGRIRYVCGRRHLKKKTVEGCGYEGETTLRGGKVDWYIEWALDWAYFDVDVEPMGKDHWVSSFRISPAFARELFGVEAPVPVPYEFFTVDGKKMSGSKGNLYNITELLKMLEPEIVIYFYTKRPMSQRDISLKNLNLLVAEWDRLESRVFDMLEGKAEPVNQDLVVYYLCMRGNIPDRRPLRLQYNFAAAVGQVLKDPEEIRKVLVRTGHVPADAGEEFWQVVERVKRATYWAEHYGPDRMRITLLQEPPAVLSGEDRKVVEDILERLSGLDEWTVEAVQTAVHSAITGRADARRFYPVLYRAILGKDAGPRLGTLFSILGKEESLRLLGKLAGKTL